MFTPGDVIVALVPKHMSQFTGLIDEHNQRVGLLHARQEPRALIIAVTHDTPFGLELFVMTCEMAPQCGWITGNDCELAW